MLVQIIGTNRPGSNSKKVAAHVAEIYEAAGGPLHVLDLQLLPPEVFSPASYAEKPAGLAPFAETILQASGVVIVLPEYNGGAPGVFKYFLDLLKFPESFSGVPVVFVGLSAGMSGGLRPVEQVTTLLNYLGALVFPRPVYLPGIYQHLDEAGRIKTPELRERIEKQAAAFLSFVAANAKKS